MSKPFRPEITDAEMRAGIRALTWAIRRGYSCSTFETALHRTAEDYARRVFGDLTTAKAGQRLLDKLTELRDDATKGIR